MFLSGVQERGSKSRIKDEVKSTCVCARLIPPVALPPPGIPASRTGSRMAHITVKAEMQSSLHSSPFDKQRGFYIATLLAVKDIHPISSRI